MTNPYLDPHADDDLFADPGASTEAPSHIHTFGGRPCRKPGCGATHQFIGSQRPEDLPEPARAELDHLLDQLDPDVRRKALLGIQRLGQPSADPMAPDDVAQALNTMTGELAHVNGHAPLLRAMAELVDELSGHQLGPRFRHYRFEHEITLIRLLQGAINTFATRHADEMSKILTEDAIVELRERMSDIDARVAELIADYCAHAAAHDLELDDGIINHGVPTTTGTDYIDHTVQTMLTAELALLGITHLMRHQ